MKTRTRRWLYLMLFCPMALLLLCSGLLGVTVFRPLFTDRPNFMGMVYAGPWTVQENQSRIQGNFYGDYVNAPCRAGPYDIYVIDIRGTVNPEIVLELESSFANTTITVREGDEIIFPEPCTGTPIAIGKVALIDPEIPFEIPGFMQRYFDPPHEAVLELYDSWITNPEELKEFYPPQDLSRP